MDTFFDTIIVGAGAAGLACARKLTQAGQKILIIEARSRIGGRILTHREASLEVPIELGAEFIHGAPKSVLEKLESEGSSFYDVLDDHVIAEKGHFKKRDDFWDKISEVMKKLDPKKDRSFAEFLEQDKPSDKETLDLVKAFVEGFHAADTSKIGEKALRESEQTQDDTLSGAQLFRTTKGYDTLCANLLHGLEPMGEFLLLNTIVKKIEWNRGNTTVECLSGSGIASTYHSERIVVTVPLGVLKAKENAKAAIQFEPEPAQLRNALGGMEMGSALRLTLRFRHRFWEDHAKEPLAFLHTTPDKPFPTWWTHAPVRSPVLTAWQGGPKARELAAQPEEKIVLKALQTLSHMMGISVEHLNDELQGWDFHCWDTDPFALGAYSYICKDGWDAVAALAQPIEDTLYFAGEATSMNSGRGTVHGAIESGEKAAEQILEAYKAKSGGRSQQTTAVY